MFYSEEVLTLKSKTGMGVVWLAATLGPHARSTTRRLSRRDVQSVNIQQAWYDCSLYSVYSDYLTDPPEPLSLRLQASLLVGVCRIYGQQYGTYCGLVEGFWKDLCGGFQLRLSEVQQSIQPAEMTKKRKSIEQLEEIMKQEEEVDVNEFLERLMTPEKLRKQSISTVQSKSTSLLNTNYSSVGTPAQMDDANLTVRLEDFGGLFDDLGAVGDDGGYSSVATPLGTLLHPSSITKQPASLNVIGKKKRTNNHCIVLDEEIMLDARQMFKPLNLLSRNKAKKMRIDFSKPFDAVIWELFYPPALPPTPHKTPQKRESSTITTSSTIIAGNFILNQSNNDSISLSAGGYEYNYADDGAFYNDVNKPSSSLAASSDSVSELLKNGKSFFEIFKKTGRKTACRGFYKLLELATENSVRVRQISPFADIQINPLF